MKGPDLFWATAALWLIFVELAVIAFFVGQIASK